MCVQAFGADPDRMPTRRIPSTAPAYAVNGKAYHFSSEKTRDAFAKNPARYLQGG
jgi:YHS domain-containing protein